MDFGQNLPVSCMKIYTKRVRNEMKLLLMPKDDWIITDQVQFLQYRSDTVIKTCVFTRQQ